MDNIPVMPPDKSIPGRPVNLPTRTDMPVYTPVSPGGQGAAADLSFDDRVANIQLKPQGADFIPASAIYTGGRYEYSYPNSDTEEMYAQQQGAWTKWGNGFMKFTGTTATTFLNGTVGAIVGTGAMIMSGKLSSFYNNPVNRGLDEFNKKMEDWLPNFYTHAEQDANWYSPKNIMTANFWSDKVLKNLGFSIGTLAGGVAWAAAFRAIGLTNALVRAGKGAEAATAVDEAIATAPKIGRFGAVNGALEGMADNYGIALKQTIANNGERGLISVMGTLGEASIEALQNMNSVRDVMIKDYISKNGLPPTGADLDEIDMYTDKIGNYTLGMNIALLSATNYAQLPKILSTSKRAEKKMMNDVIKERALQGASAMERAATKYKVAPSIFERTAGKPGKLFDKYIVKPASLLFAPIESFEEFAQYSIQTGTEDYYQRAYKNHADINDFWTNFDESMGSVLGHGVNETLTTKAGMEGALIGGISGGLQTSFSPFGQNNIVTRGFFGEGGIKGRNTDLALTALNNSKNLNDVLKDRIKYINIGINSQNLRQQSIANDDTFNEKNYEHDYAFSYIMPRIKYGKLDTINEELDLYRQQAAHPQGFQQLLDEGIALPEETQQQFAARLNNIQATAEQINQVYTMLDDKYSAIVDDKGKRLYEDNIIEKMTYASAKVIDFDKRLHSLSGTLAAKSIDTMELQEAMQKSKAWETGDIKALLNDPEIERIIGKTFTGIETNHPLDSDKLKQDVTDFAEMVLHRKKFIDEYTEMKNTPDKYNEKVVTAAETEAAKKAAEKGETVEVKTKGGPRKVNVGMKYLLGRVVEYDKNGNEVYRMPEITILKRNEDGTIQIQGANGVVKNITDEQLEDYNLVNPETLEKNPKAKFVTKVWNVVYEHYGIKDKNGKPLRGRIIYDSVKDRMLFEYKDLKGKIRREPVSNENFTFKSGGKYVHALLVAVDNLTPLTAEQKVAEQQISQAKETDDTRSVLIERRLELLYELSETLQKNLASTRDFLDKKRKQLERINEGIALLTEDIESENLLDKRKVFGFKKGASKYLAAAQRLSRMKRAAEERIADLEAQEADIQNNLARIEDMAQYIDELPADSKAFLEQLRDNRDKLQFLAIDTASQISQFKKLVDGLTEALNKAIEILMDMVKSLTNNVSWRLVSQGYIEPFEQLIANPKFLKDEASYQADMDYIDELITESEDAEIRPKQEQIIELTEKIETLQEDMVRIEKDLSAADLIYNYFNNINEEYKEQKKQEKELQHREELRNEFIGTDDTDIPSVSDDPDNRNYEVEKKKNDHEVVNSGRPVSDDVDHQQRVNHFGTRYHNFENKDKLRAVVVTSATEEEAKVPGLMNHLISYDQDADTLKPETVIALVVMEVSTVNGVTTYTPVDQDGKPIASGDVLNQAIYQVFPTESLSYYGEELGMFRKGGDINARKEIQRRFVAWRAATLAKTTLSASHTFKVSMGQPQYVGETVLDEKGKKQTNRDWSARTSVQEAGLIDISDFTGRRLIKVATEDSISHGSTTFDKSLGRVFMMMGNGLVKLYNRQLTKKEVDNIYAVILQIAKNAQKDGTVKNTKNQILFDWLKSVIYWGIARDTQTGQRKEKAGYNNVWFEDVNVDGNITTKLFISGLSKQHPEQAFDFVPSAIERNKEDIKFLLSQLYNNTRASLTNDKQFRNPYNELLGLDKNGDPVFRQWPNYQTYQTSDKIFDAEGKIAGDRNKEDIPLVTMFRPLKNEQDTNVDGVYITLDDSVDDVVVSQTTPIVPPPIVTPTPASAPMAKPAAQPAQKFETEIANPHGYVLDDRQNVRKLGTGGEVKFIFNVKNVAQIVKRKGTDVLSDALKRAEFIKTLIETNVFQIVYTTVDQQGKEVSSLELFRRYLQTFEDQEKSGKQISDEDAQRMLIDGVLFRELIPFINEQLAKMEQPATTETKTESTDEDKIDDEFNTPGGADPIDPEFRLQLVKSANQFEEEDWKKVEAFLKKVFPHIPVYRIQQMMKNVNGKQVWGMLQDNAIYLAEHAETGTIYHEVFEAVWKTFTSVEEREKVNQEFRNRRGVYKDRFTGKVIAYKDATSQQIKEELAEEFRDFILYGKTVTQGQEKAKSWIARIFQEIWNAIKTFFVGDNARRNTQDLFDKIGNGYYAKFNPYESALAVGRVGIQILPSVEVKSYAETRINTIPALQMFDVLQQMTHTTLLAIAEANEDILSKRAVNKTELYPKLQDQLKTLIKGMKNYYEAARDHGEITAETAEREIHSLGILFTNVKRKWDQIIDEYEHKMDAYGVEFTEDDEIALKDEEKGKDNPYGDPTKIDGFRKANKAVKLLFATLPYMTIQDGKRAWKKSSIGGVTLMPADQAFISVKHKLHDAVGIDDMLDKLERLAIDNPVYEALYKRLAKTLPVPNKMQETFPEANFIDFQKHNIQLVSAFWRAIKGQNPDVISVFILQSGDVVISDTALNSATREAKKQMATAIVNKIKEGIPYFRYDAKTGKYYANSQMTAINLKGGEVRPYIEFLKTFDIHFTENELTTKLNGHQLSMFRDAVKKFQKNMSTIGDKLVNAKGEPILDEKGNPADSAISIITPNTLDSNKRLTEIAIVRAIIDNPDFESTYFNVNGERSQTYIGTNAASNLYDILKKIKKIDDLRGTEFEYLLTDPFAEGSMLLKSMFDMSPYGKRNRIDGTEEVLHPMIIDGLINELKGKKKSSSKLSSRERLRNELNLNFWGIYLNLVPGDASLEHALRMYDSDSPFVTDESFATGTYLQIFRNYFISEVKLAQSNRIVAKKKDGKNLYNPKDLRFFKSILGDILHKKIMADVDETADPVKLYESNKKEINNAVQTFIKSEAVDTYSLLTKYGLLGYDAEKGLVADGLLFAENIDELNESNLMDRINVISANYIISNIEMHKVLYSDPYQYTDELKRIKNFLSPRQGLMYGSSQVNETLDREYNKNYEKGDIAWTDMLRNYFRSITLGDVLSTYSLIGYARPFEETDGGGVIILKGLRIFKIRAGEWTSDNERQYEYDVAYEKNVKGIRLSEREVELFAKGNPNIMDTYTPLKPIVSGNKANGRGFNDIVLHKFALVPMSFRLLHEINPTSNALKLYNKMQAEDIDYAVYESGSKVGTEKVSPIYTNKGEFDTTPFETDGEKLGLPMEDSELRGVTKIPFSIISIQSEVPSKDTPKVTQGSQVTKLATMDYLEAGVPIDFDENNEDFDDRFAKWTALDKDQRLEQSELWREIKHNQDLLEAKIKAGYDVLLRKMGIVRTLEGFVLTDPSKVIDAIKEEMTKRDVNDNILDAFEGFKQGQVVLEATPAYQQIRNILYSIADSNVVSQKINGGLKVQVTSAMLESVRAEAEIIEDKYGVPKQVFASTELSFYKNEDGKRICGIMLGRWFKSKKTDQELMDYFNNTPEGKKQLAALMGVAYRIPTQKQNSIDVFRIEKFLPQDFGDSVIVPSALVRKTGSDFDIDKLSIYLKNLKNGPNGFPVLIEYLDEKNSTLEQRYAKWVYDRADRDTRDAVRLLSAERIKEIREKYQPEFERLQEKYRDIEEGVLGEEYETYKRDLSDIRTDTRIEQDLRMKQLFRQGKDIFRTLPQDAKDGYRMIAKFIRDNEMNGPEEIELYLKFSQGIMIDDSIRDEIKDIVIDLISNYEEELRTLGATNEELAAAKSRALDNFRARKKTSLGNLQDFIEEERNNVIAEQRAEVKDFYNTTYIKELAEEMGLPTIDDFSKFTIENQNIRKALENEYIQSLQNLISNERNFENLTKPNSAQVLQEIEAKITKQIGGLAMDYSNVGNMINRRAMNQLRYNFVSGKQAIAIAAIGQTNAAQSQRAVMYVDTDRLATDIIDDDDKKWLGDGHINFLNYNKIKLPDGTIRATLSKIKDANTDPKKVRFYITDINGMMIDGYVDITKDDWIMRLGATPNVTATWMFLNKIGVPIEDVAYFMNQPIIKDYLQRLENNGYVWLFNDTVSTEVADEYAPSKDLGTAIAEIPTTGEMWTMLEYNKEEKNKKDMSDLQKAQQQFMLGEFLKYAKMAQHLFYVTQGSNFDTATINDPMLIFKKMMQLEKAKKTIISSVDDLLEASFVGYLKDIMINMRDVFSTVLMSEKPDVRRVLQTVLMEYINESDRDFVKISQKVVNDLFDWAVQTNMKVNQGVAEVLLGNESQKSVNKQIMSLKKEALADPNHPLYRNVIINALQDEPGTAKTKVNNVSLSGVYNKVFDQNIVIQGFRELRKYLTDNNNKKLYGNLVRLAVIQSGLSNSKIAFTNLLPYDDFVKVYNKTLSILETLPNLQNFAKINAFHRNNATNPDIVTAKRMKLIKYQKDGVDQYFNPDDVVDSSTVENKVYTLQNAVKKGIVPKLAAFSVHSDAGRAEFVTYTWEDKISKELRIKRRKSGDTSHIHKALMKKVRDSNGNPVKITNESISKSTGDIIVFEKYLYKTINAWGDSFRANEFYDKMYPAEPNSTVAQASVLDNGFIKVNEMEDEDVLKIMNGTTAPPKTSAPQTLSVSGIVFEQDDTSDYRARTIKNAKADATIAIAYDFTTAGEVLTKNAVVSINKKKYVKVDLMKRHQMHPQLQPNRLSVDAIVDQLNSANTKTLNIAGNGIVTLREAGYTQADADALVYNLLDAVIRSPRLNNKIEVIISGGQTGIDEAGIKAAVKLGIPAKILAPQGWKYRPEKNRDVSSESSFKARFGITTKNAPENLPPIDRTPPKC